MVTNKICLITGSTSGIGKATAVELAKKGYQLIITGRNVKRGQRVIEEIAKKTGNNNIELLIADLSKLIEIKELAEKIIDNYNRLDVLINNAATYQPNLVLTEQNVEKTFAVNHLGYFFLTVQLLDLLKKSSPSRVVNVSSNAHFGQILDLNHVVGENAYTGAKAYSHSKLANVLFTYELAERLKEDRVTVNALHPGVVRTRIIRERKISFLWQFNPFFTSPTKAARTSVYLATSSEVEGITGKYFENRKIRRSSEESYKENPRKQLWDFSVNIIEKFLEN